VQNNKENNEEISFLSNDWSKKAVSSPFPEEDDVQQALHLLAFSMCGDDVTKF